MECSPFVGFLGDYPRIRVLDYLLENREAEYSKTELAKKAGVSFNTLEGFWGELLEGRVLVCAKKVGTTQLYRLNSENEFVGRLLDLDERLLLRHLKELEAKVL
jgi:DNA-binding transcriptional ArsR family regulator